MTEQEIINAKKYYADKMQEYGIPEHMQEAIVRYVVHRRLPGSFLTKVLRNDLKGACERADEINKYRLYSYVKCFYNVLPIESWGSPEAVESWVK